MLRNCVEPHVCEASEPHLYECLEHELRTSGGRKFATLLNPLGKLDIRTAMFADMKNFSPHLAAELRIDRT